MNEINKEAKEIVTNLKLEKKLVIKLTERLYLMNFLEVDIVQMHQFIKSNLLV